MSSSFVIERLSLKAALSGSQADRVKNLNPSPVYNRAVRVATPLDQTDALAGIQSCDWGLIYSVIQFDVAGDRVDGRT